MCFFSRPFLFMYFLYVILLIIDSSVSFCYYSFVIYYIITFPIYFFFWVEGRICPDASMTFVWIFLFAWNNLITMIFHRFNLLYEECIEFNKLGLRDNVAQLCVLEVHNALILSSVLFNFCWDKLRMFNYLILHPLIDVPGFPSNIFILQIIYRNGSFPSR